MLNFSLCQWRIYGIVRLVYIKKMFCFFHLFYPDLKKIRRFVLKFLVWRLEKKDLQIRPDTALHLQEKQHVNPFQINVPFLYHSLKTYNSFLYPVLRKYRQKQSSRGVLWIRCSENMQQIYGRTSTPKCDFNKVVLQFHWNRTSACVFSCKFATYFHNNFF